MLIKEEAVLLFFFLLNTQKRECNSHKEKVVYKIHSVEIGF